MTTFYNADETIRRYHELMANEPDFFLKPDCSICMLSDRLGIDSTFTSRFISFDLKTTFSGLVRAAQLRKLETLVMTSPKRKIKDLMHEAGFTCQISFRRAYMEKYGELPSRINPYVLSGKT